MGRGEKKNVDFPCFFPPSFVAKRRSDGGRAPGESRCDLRSWRPPDGSCGSQRLRLRPGRGAEGRGSGHRWVKSRDFHWRTSRDFTNKNSEKIGFSPAKGSEKLKLNHQIIMDHWGLTSKMVTNRDFTSKNDDFASQNKQSQEKKWENMENKKT